MCGWRSPSFKPKLKSQTVTGVTMWKPCVSRRCIHTGANVALNVVAYESAVHVQVHACYTKCEFLRGSLRTKFTMALVGVNGGPPICCFLIIPCYLWKKKKKKRAEEYGRGVQQPSFSIYSFTLLAISAPFVKSAVAAGGEFAQNVLPGVCISCREERRQKQQLRRIRQRGKGNE